MVLVLESKPFFSSRAGCHTALFSPYKVYCLIASTPNNPPISVMALFQPNDDDNHEPNMFLIHVHI